MINPLTVFLIKKDISEAKHIFKSHENLCQKPKDDSWLFYKESKQQKKKWAPFIEECFEIDKNVFFHAHSSAVIIIKTNGRFFAICFDMGFHLIDMSAIEYNFGLKIALNCISKDQLRQIDLTTPQETFQKTKKQSLKSSSAEDFKVNFQRDILRGVTGKLPNKHFLGYSVEGKDSVKFSKKCKSLDDLKKICIKLLEYFFDDKYKEDFGWINNISIVSDPQLETELDLDLIKHLTMDADEKILITTPEFIDFSKSKGFVFTGNGKKNKLTYIYPNVKNLKKELGAFCLKNLNPLKISKNIKVFLKDENDELRYGWPLKQCLSWEISRKNIKYILSDGIWYKIDDDFYKSISNFFKQRSKINTRFKSLSNLTTKEALINHAFCQQDEHLHLFDLGHPEARHRYITSDGNEICDIYDSKYKTFYHIKFGKNSPDISHVLRQGIFSAKILKIDSNQRDCFINYLVQCGCDRNIISLPFNTFEYTIVFGVLLYSNQEADIPFFSKVSFKDATENLIEIMGYKCEFQYIYI